MRYPERIKKLATLLPPHGLGAFIVWDPLNLYYFTGVPGPGILIVSSDGDAKLYVPPINYQAAERYATNAVDLEGTRLDESLEVVAAQAISGVDGVVGIDRIDVEAYRRLTSMLPNLEVAPHSEIVWDMRMKKDDDEIRLISEAARIADKAMKAAVNLLSPGVMESEIKSEIVAEIYRHVGDRPSFDVIVASSVRSSLPHGPLPKREDRDRMIERGDVVLIDLGVVIEGYCSDLTRTFVISRDVDREIREAYELTIRAKESAESLIKPGSSCNYIDSVARRVLAEKGLDRYFNHSLGHGVGLEIHEPPRIGPGSPDQLSENMVVTCEPGVYLPSKWGIRVEDTVLVSEKGAIKLTAFPIDEFETI